MRREKEEIKKRQKIEVIIAKRHKTRVGITLSNKEENESDTGNNTDPNQTKDKYPLQL